MNQVALNVFKVLCKYLDVKIPYISLNDLFIYFYISLDFKLLECFFFYVFKPDYYKAHWMSSLNCFFFKFKRVDSSILVFLFNNIDINKQKTYKTLFYILKDTSNCQELVSKALIHCIESLPFFSPHLSPTPKGEFRKSKSSCKLNRYFWTVA